MTLLSTLSYGDLTHLDNKCDRIQSLDLKTPGAHFPDLVIGDSVRPDTKTATAQFLDFIIAPLWTMSLLVDEIGMSDGKTGSHCLTFLLILIGYESESGTPRTVELLL